MVTLALDLPVLRGVLPASVPVIPGRVGGFLPPESLRAVDVWRSITDLKQVEAITGAVATLGAYSHLLKRLKSSGLTLPESVNEELALNAASCNACSAYLWILLNEPHLSLSFLIQALTYEGDSADSELEIFLHDCSEYLLVSLHPCSLPALQDLLCESLTDRGWHKDLIDMRHAFTDLRNSEVAQAIHRLRGCSESNDLKLSCAAHYLLALVYGHLHLPKEELEEYKAWYEKATAAFESESVVAALGRIRQEELSSGILNGVVRYGQLLGAVQDSASLDLLVSELRTWGQSSTLSQMPAIQQKEDGIEIFFIDRAQAKNTDYVSQLVYDAMTHVTARNACVAIRDGATGLDSYEKDERQTVTDLIAARLEVGYEGWQLRFGEVHHNQKTWLVIRKESSDGKAIYIAVVLDEQAMSFSIELFPAYVFPTEMAAKEHVEVIRGSIEAAANERVVDDVKLAITRLCRTMSPSALRRIELPPG